MKLFSLGVLVCLSLLLSCCLGSNDSFDYAAQFKSDTTLLGSYVRLFAPSAIKLPSGVWFEIDTLGTGYYPSFADTILFTYKGTLLASGTVFDKSTSPVAYTLPNLITGWQIGLPKFQEGAFGKLYVPSGLAYGNQPLGNIPANSNLVFEIKVTKVSGYNTKQNIKAIDKYITDHSISNVMVDPSGIRYTIDTQAQGPSPLASDYIKVTYTGQLLAAPNTVFNTVSTPTEYYLPGLVNSWAILLPKIPIGTSLTMYVPSGLAYDVFTNVQNVPANSNVIYHVTLISARH